MRIIQIAVFLENKKGRLKEITDILASQSIDIRALSIAETKDFGVIRLIVNHPDRAYAVLKANELTVRKTEVLAVEVEDQPGGLNYVLGILEKNSVNIEYMYAFVEKASDKALLVMRFDDLDRAEKILSENKVSIVKADKIYKN
ncbi:MAG TPA: amino acid-binding protein [Spirochaetia bacterium]|nr:amino acid-binding protein [Spirochaetia bacterium]